MPLIEKPTMTEKKVAANRRNGDRSRGAVTEAGMDRIREAGLRHGFYAQAPEGALQRLGEDPAQFEELLAGLRQEFAPVGVLQEELVNRLARVLWLMGRADRCHEGQALSHARIADRGRDNRMNARMMRLKMTAETLRSLARSVAVWHYVTTKEDLEVMKKLRDQDAEDSEMTNSPHGHDPTNPPASAGVMGEMGGIALDLLYQLQLPDTDEDGLDPREKARRVVNTVRSIFGISPLQPEAEKLDPTSGPPAEEDEDSDKDDRYPTIPEADCPARERARKLLRNILSRQAEACEEQRKALLRESLAGPSPFELAAETAPSRAEALFTRRIQDANIREVRRLTNLLLKIQGRQGNLKSAES